jgi:subfamily B ATP-binding cassette protein HlyB/CyaB
VSAESGRVDVPDTGLFCLLILARFYDLPADGSQLRHMYAQSGQRLSAADLLRAGKHLGLKAGVVKTEWRKLSVTPLPAIATLRGDRYVVLAKIEDGKALIQDPGEGRPLWCPVSSSSRIGRESSSCSRSGRICVPKT